MRTVLVSLIVAIVGFIAVAQDKKAPDKLTFKSKMGDILFDHAQHVKAAKNDCKVCHDKLWPQSSTAPLNYKSGMHKPAETKHTSCGFCHHPGGGSFAATKETCNRCHQKGAAKKS